ncbi:hypothetical protein PTSG_03276 [Salpingoeca rosetta]|uniref:Endosomal/lysosomal proton channel TMEM175 n=1 Tax=Salpingoeca rosetta (strain ATCC 50818 / BSB-021) TaxID=946362 RepID=F2U4Q5_SALR5|nr:uncharacterized protein PTSG_03276 [Salpingoeca rosetta]EGD82621.1 hypothetical protein PTSG_03276 [Salpingoeca rosetta]|eukprot:XP_004995857.1 hypothetical protein PTSG_03276 [Salpingoeca rosetta]
MEDNKHPPPQYVSAMQQQQQQQHPPQMQLEQQGGGPQSHGNEHHHDHHAGAGGETERLEIDAVIAIVATVMAIPLASLTEEEEEKDYIFQVLNGKGKQIAWFVASFNMVAYWWGYHSALMRQVEHVTFWTMLCNLLFLLSLSFYPISYVFAQDYILNWRATSLFMSILVSTALAFALLRMLSRPSAWESPARRMAWKLCMIEDATHVVVLGLALAAVQILRLVNEDYIAVGWVVVLVKTIFDVIVYRWHVRRHPRLFANPYKPGKTLRKRHFLRLAGYADVRRNRLEAFSDGVFAIAATFQFLEIKVPTPDQVPFPSFTEALSDASSDLGAYLISFGVIGMLWINHHNIVERFQCVPLLLRLVNTQQLVLVAVLPLFFSILVNFWPDRSAVIWASCAVATTGLFQLLLWGLARFLHSRAVAASASVATRTPSAHTSSSSTLLSASTSSGSGHSRPGFPTATATTATATTARPMSSSSLPGPPTTPQAASTATTAAQQQRQQEEEEGLQREEELVLKFDPYDSVRKPYVVAQLLVIPVVGFGTALAALGSSRVHLFPFLLCPFLYWLLSSLEARAVGTAIALRYGAGTSEHQPLVQRTE